MLIQRSTRDTIVAVSITGMIVVPVILLVLLANMSRGQANPVELVQSPGYERSDALRAIAQAQPNAPTDGRDPWLGTDAWLAGVQAGQEYIEAFPEPQNVQVLTGMSNADVWIYMLEVSGDLGVGCQYCHSLTNFAEDTYPEKMSGRVMFRLVNDLNGQFMTQLPEWNGNYVRCATCHNGQPTHMPAFSPALATQGQAAMTELDTQAVDPDSAFVADHPDMGMMLAMVAWMEENWDQYVLPRTQPIADPPPVNDGQKYHTYNETSYSVPGCYTCHAGQRIPPAAVSRAELDRLANQALVVFPPRVRGWDMEQVVQAP